MLPKNKARLSLPLMRLLLFLLVLVAPGFTITQILTTDRSDTKDMTALSEAQFITRVDLQIQDMMDTYSIPGASISIIKGGEAFWVKEYGYADIERNRKMTVDAIFRVESISKSVTAWGVLKLVERGLINLDDPVRQHLRSWTLPKSEYNLNGVTIRRLLGNSAGMPLGTLGEEYSPHNERPSLQHYLTKEAHLAYEPGSNFQYSNPGFNLLELLIEEVTGRDFNEYMENEVLIPLGMNNSSFNWNEGWSSRISMGYDIEGNPVLPYVYPYKASGGLFADVEDIALFVMAEMNSGYYADSTVLSKRSIQHIQMPQINITGIFGFVADAYGFGHFIETLPDGYKAVWHGGQGHGWMTHFHAVPETGDGIIILTNSQRSWPFIARILNEWSRWRGFGPVKFSKITTAETGLRIILAVMLLITIWLAGQVIHGVITGKRKLRLSPKLRPETRIAEFCLGIAILGMILWAVSQDYLFISSLFPTDALWLGWELLFLSLVLLALALLPVVRSTEPSTLNLHAT